MYETGHILPNSQIEGGCHCMAGQDVQEEEEGQHQAKTAEEQATATSTTIARSLLSGQ